MDRQKPLTGRVILDEHDDKAGSLFEEYLNKKKPELLQKAYSEIILSSNPEKDKIAILYRGLYYREKGLQEKDNSKAKKLFLKSINFLGKVDGDEKLTKEVELEFIKRKLQIEKGNGDKPDEKLFLRSANLHKELGHEKSFNAEMSLYYLFYITNNADKFSSQEIVNNAGLMLSCAEKCGIPELLHKTKALYHEIKAKYSENTKAALSEWENAVKEIQQTSDKFHLEETKTEFLMSQAMSTVNPNQRNVILEKVAKRYKRQGEKVKEDFVRKLMSPVPIKIAQVIYLADLSVEKLRTLEKDINSIKRDKKGPFAVFYHLSYMLERVEDVKRILVRMALTRKTITQLHIQEGTIRPVNLAAGKPYPKRLQNILKKNDNLRKQMKQDMESLFIYGNLLLDQWSYLIGYIAGYVVSENVKTSSDEHELNFNGLLNLLQNKNYKGELLELWDKHKKDIIWLNFHLRFFRNVFVEHLRKPWQRGNTMGVYGDDFNLHIPAAVGYIKPDEENKLLNGIYPLAPQKLKNMPDDYWEKRNLKRVLEVTLYYIDTIEKQSDRDKVWNVWNNIGGSTPSYDVIAFRLFNYVCSSIDTIITLMQKHPQLLKLGEF